MEELVKQIMQGINEIKEEQINQGERLDRIESQLKVQSDILQYRIESKLKVQSDILQALKFIRTS